MDKQKQFDLHYLEMARIWARNSYCGKKKSRCTYGEGPDDYIDGYNGTPAAVLKHL